MRGEKVGGRTSGREHCKGPLCGGSAGRQGVRADRCGGGGSLPDWKGRAEQTLWWVLTLAPPSAPRGWYLRNRAGSPGGGGPSR